MDENSQSLSPFYSQPESPKIFIPKPASSGLTLVIPSLKSLKASQNANKPKQPSGSYPRSASIFQDVDNQEKKIQRPVKLKPLKEVLFKLIAQLKKLVKIFSWAAAQPPLTFNAERMTTPFSYALLTLPIFQDTLTLSSAQWILVPCLTRSTRGNIVRWKTLL